MALVVFFCSADYDLDDLASEIQALFAGVEVVGCTTAGEIGPAGYRDHSISGVSFGAASFVAASGQIDDLRQFDAARGGQVAHDVLERLDGRDGAAAGNRFALLLIDGLSVREEPVTRALQLALGQVPLVGGSAGDGLRFGVTHVFSDGAFRTDSAVVVVVDTPLPVRTFKTQHVVSTPQRVVVTGADPEHRVVTEIDGWPAADAYARLVGAARESLDPKSFATQPMVVLIDGADYVRSIQQANPDGSLTFFCAIEEGLVLRAARCGDLVKDLERAFADIRAAIGDLALVIGFDCILRKLEVIDHRLGGRLETTLREINFVGFSSYGEQYGGVHVNQTLTGIAIGEPTYG